MDALPGSVTWWDACSPPIFDRINRDGGIYNRQVVLKTAAFDSSGSAVDALRRLTTETDIFAVVAPVVLGQEVPFAEFSESAALPVIGPFAQYRRNERQDFTFYLTSGLEDQVRALVKYAQNDLAPDVPKIAILSSDDGANLSISDAIRQQSRNAEWAPALTLRLTGGTAIADIASQLRLAEVNIIFYDGGPTRLVALTEAAAQLGMAASNPDDQSSGDKRTLRPAERGGRPYLCCLSAPRQRPVARGAEATPFPPGCIRYPGRSISRCRSLR